MKKENTYLDNQLALSILLIKILIIPYIIWLTEIDYKDKFNYSL